MNHRIEIVGVPIDNLDYEGVLRRVEDYILKDRKVYIVTANPEMILKASEDEEFCEILKSAEINTPDGIGIIWAAHYLSRPQLKGRFKNYFQLAGSLTSILFFPKKTRTVLKERVTGTDLIPKIVDLSQDKAWRIFLLGASDGIAKRAAKQFLKAYPKAKIVGHFSGSASHDDEEEICEKINAAKPDILFVAFGSPKQELWIHRNLFKLKSVKVAIGVGGAFDFHAGKIKRAPKWMQKVGLEWLWRLGREPKRVGRIWNATIRFTKLVAKEKMGDKPVQ